MIDYILGALTMLIGVIVGHCTGKPWVDKWFARLSSKPETKQIETK
jgi:hypothetical protein